MTLPPVQVPEFTIPTVSSARGAPVTSAVRKKNWGRYLVKKGVWRPPSSFVRAYSSASNLRRKPLLQ